MSTTGFQLVFATEYMIPSDLALAGPPHDMGCRGGRNTAQGRQGGGWACRRRLLPLLLRLLLDLLLALLLLLHLDLPGRLDHRDTTQVKVGWAQVVLQQWRS